MSQRVSYHQVTKDYEKVNLTTLIELGIYSTRSFI